MNVFRRALGGDVENVAIVGVGFLGAADAVGRARRRARDRDFAPGLRAGSRANDGGCRDDCVG